MKIASKLARSLILAVALLSVGVASAACPKAPPTLVTSVGKAAFAADQIIGHLDTVTNLVIAAHAQTDVPQAHINDQDELLLLGAIKAATRTLMASPDGGRAAALTAWQESKKLIPPDQLTRIGKYLGMIDILLMEVK